MKGPMTTKGAGIPPPSKLSPRSQKLWGALHDANIFTVDAEELLLRALERFDLADELRDLARTAGLTSKDGRAALASARDSEVTGLKLFIATGLTKDDIDERRRPGRPSDTSWSAMRRPRRETAL